MDYLACYCPLAPLTYYLNMKFLNLMNQFSMLDPQNM